MKRYIAYRYYSTMLGWTYERKELSEKELTTYIKEHLGKLKNIEIFTRGDKIKINVNIETEWYKWQ